VRKVNRGFCLLVHRDAQQAGDMVAVFVGDENRIQLVDIFTDGCQPLAGLEPAEASVDQDTRTVRRDKRGVARTTRR
jgi:hypothetical protein